ncbi:unnamed protein product [Sphenostylis stenocarpa]|uniref:Uncharacterized protein n=1 Tax=Sphenostylis stenocarpa TaxID=92480 RepID=A0AA86V592_9FABA|nr:unnamed protein product [Sphenostylis stenocarpa]
MDEAEAKAIEDGEQGRAKVVKAKLPVGEEERVEMYKDEINKVESGIADLNQNWNWKSELELKRCARTSAQQTAPRCRCRRHRQPPAFLLNTLLHLLLSLQRAQTVPFLPPIARTHSPLDRVTLTCILSACFEDDNLLPQSFESTGGNIRLVETGANIGLWAWWILANACAIQ